jgi:hypothetical protein
VVTKFTATIVLDEDAEQPPDLDSKMEEILTACVNVGLGAIQEAVIDGLRSNNNAAGKPMNSLASKYEQGMQLESGPGSGSLMLETPQANAIEEGWESFDMRNSWLSRSTKMSEFGGRYVDIAFTFSGSGTVGVAGRPMSEPASSSIDMAVANKKKFFGENWGKARSGYREPGLKRSGGYVGPAESRTRNYNGKDRTYTHTTGIETDMMAYQRQSGGAEGTGYRTFRRMSERASDPDAWIQPAFPGVHMFDRMPSGIESDLIVRIENALAAWGVKATVTLERM